MMQMPILEAAVVMREATVTLARSLASFEMMMSYFSLFCFFFSHENLSLSIALARSLSKRNQSFEIAASIISLSLVCLLARFGAREEREREEKGGP